MHTELEEMWFQWLPHSRLVLRALQVSDLEHFLKSFCINRIDDFALLLLDPEALEVDLRMSAPERIRFFAAVGAIAVHELPANDPNHPGHLPIYLFAN